MMMQRCVCRQGRDHDGSEFGPCEFCEQQQDQLRAARSEILDAMRWRMIQRADFEINRSYGFNEADRNLVVVYVEGRPAGCGPTVQDAVDCAIFLADSDDQHAVLHFWQENYKARWDGATWTAPPQPKFYLGDDDVLCLEAALPLVA